MQQLDTQQLISEKKTLSIPRNKTKLTYQQKQQRLQELQITNNYRSRIDTTIQLEWAKSKPFCSYYLNSICQ